MSWAKSLPPFFHEVAYVGLTVLSSLNVSRTFQGKSMSMKFPRSNFLFSCATWVICISQGVWVFVVARFLLSPLQKLWDKHRGCFGVTQFIWFEYKGLLGEETRKRGWERSLLTISYGIKAGVGVRTSSEASPAMVPEYSSGFLRLSGW